MLHSWRNTILLQTCAASTAAWTRWDTQLDRAVAKPAIYFRKTMMIQQFHERDEMQNGHASGLQRPKWSTKYSVEAANKFSSSQRAVKFTYSQLSTVLSHPIKFDLVSCLWYRLLCFVHWNRYVNYGFNCNRHKDKAFWAPDITDIWKEKNTTLCMQCVSMYAIQNY